MTSCSAVECHLSTNLSTLHNAPVAANKFRAVRTAKNSKSRKSTAKSIEGAAGFVEIQVDSCDAVYLSCAASAVRHGYGNFSSFYFLFYAAHEVKSFPSKFCATYIFPRIGAYLFVPPVGTCGVTSFVVYVVRLHI